MLTDPDASGGLGSFASDLLGTLTGGLKAVTAGELIKRYGYGDFTDLPTINANGQVRPGAAPTSPYAGIGSIASNPLVILGAVLVVGLVIIKLVRS